MTALVPLFGTTLVVTATLMLSVWAISITLHDASIVDIFWGIGFALIATFSWAVAEGYEPRRSLIAVLTGIWGGRLALYLLWRNWGREEDYRYQAMRRRHGERFTFVSLYSVFALQGALMWLVSLPVQVASSSPTPTAWTWVDAAGVALWGMGLFCESVGDWQLARFKGDPANQGKVMDRGLWAYTRHPNYFGDACVWWGLFLIALATPTGKWVIFSPVLMTFFLLRVSGVPLLERRMVKTRPEYAEYARRTSAFVPWFPKS